MQNRHPNGGRLRKPAGPSAAALKYDILTALLVTAARGEGTDARLALRLSLLITARYNWQKGTFAVGRREMARLWGVGERTVKREIAEMRARGWIGIRVAAARGRVAQYWIDLDTVCYATMAHWDAVGPDFAARMAGAPEPAAESNVVPLRAGPATGLDPERGAGAGDGPWEQAQRRLAAQDPGVFNAWFAPLVAIGDAGGTCRLDAPTRFHADYVRTHFLPRLCAALAAIDPEIREVQICHRDG